MHFQYVATNFTTLHIPAKQLYIISETIERKNPTIHPREEQGGNKRKKKLTPFFRATIGLRRTRYNPGQIYLFRAMINFIPIAPPPQILTSFLPFQNEEVVTMDSHAPYCVMDCNLRLAHQESSTCARRRRTRRGRSHRGLVLERRPNINSARGRLELARYPPPSSPYIFPPFLR